jgi:hypothetical protein
VLGHVELLDRQVGFKHSVARWVEFEDRGVVWQGHEGLAFGTVCRG